MQRLTSKRPGRILATTLLMLLGSAYLQAADPAIHCDDSVPLGSVLQVSVSGNNLENIALSLVDNRDRTISRAEGFSWRAPDGRVIYVVMLGIPSTADPGDYILVLNAEQGRAQWKQEKTLRLTDVSYPETVISMNGKMSALYSDESEQKKAESRELWAVLTTFDPAAVYQSEPFVPPLDAGIPTAGFGDRRRYRMPDGSESSSVHYGRDMWAETGTAVIAAGRGRIVLAVERILTGNTVVIEHLPGVFTMYYHMDRLDVFEGEMVVQGRQIGTVGETGFATGEHLHWEMRVGATPVDPGEFLQRPLLDTNELMSNM